MGHNRLYERMNVARNALDMNTANMTSEVYGQIEDGFIAGYEALSVIEKLQAVCQETARRLSEARRSEKALKETVIRLAGYLPERE